MYKVLLKLDKFFWKYEKGVKLTPPPPFSPGKTDSKKPSLIRVKASSSLLDKFLQALRLNRILQKSYFTVSPSHFFCSKQGFFNFFSVILYDEVFQTINFKRIKEKDISFWFNIKDAPPMCPTLVLAITKGHFPFLENIMAEWLINLFI